MPEPVSENGRSQRVYRFGLFTLDSESGVLKRDDIRVKIQEQPFQLLVLLLDSPGSIVSKEEIRQRLWPKDTFVEFDKSLGVAMVKAREALGDTASNPRFIETVPRRGYRFLAPVQIETAGALTAPSSTRQKTIPKNLWLILIGVSLLALVAGIWYWLAQAPGHIPEHLAVVVGDFANDTGDPIFDGSLRRAVVIHLSQSPYLSVLPDQKLGVTLQNIGRSADEALTPALAMQVCQRLNAAALVNGLIRSSSQRYSLTVLAQRCADGASLARETFAVENKQEVLPRLSAAIDDLRRNLGESRKSLESFDVSMEQATTSSLEALKAYQLGLELRSHSKNVEARDVLKTAIALDPDFAIAYAQLGSAYSNLGEPSLAMQYFQKAFALRAHATEPERLYITSRYFDIVTGEREKGSETAKLWIEMYPNDWKPYNGIANNAVLLGQYQTAVDNARKAMELGPGQDFGSSNLVAGLIGVNRLDEAKSVCEGLLASGHDNSFIHLDLFAIAHLENDQAAIEHQLEWARHHPNDVGMVFAEGSAAASEGKLEVATQLFDQTAELDVASGDSEAAAIALAMSAEINSEMGRASIAKMESDRALSLGRNEMVYGLSGLVALRRREVQRAQFLLDQMDHEHPLATFNLGIYSPMIRTLTAISRGSSLEQVTDLMEPALPYEFGSLADMLPIYVRGTAYLSVNAPAKAEIEFEKIILHRNIDSLTTLYPLSILGLARCYRKEGRLIESRKAYQELFTLWKNADGNLPILSQARSESKAISR